MRKSSSKTYIPHSRYLTLTLVFKFFREGPFLMRTNREGNKTHVHSNDVICAPQDD